MAEKKHRSKVGEDAQKMINNPQYSDLVFLCKDGIRIYALRLFLAARSKYFCSMFLSEMKESQLPEVILQDVSSTEMLAVVEYLYTGSLERHLPKDWKSACDIIAAADRLSIDSLEFFVADFLMAGLTKAETDAKAAVELMSMTVEYAYIRSKTMKNVMRRLTCILLIANLTPEHMDALSTDAFLYFLQDTKAACQDIKPRRKAVKKRTGRRGM